MAYASRSMAMQASKTANAAAPLGPRREAGNLELHIVENRIEDSRTDPACRSQCQLESSTVVAVPVPDDQIITFQAVEDTRERRAVESESSSHLDGTASGVASDVRENNRLRALEAVLTSGLGQHSAQCVVPSVDRANHGCIDLGVEDRRPAVVFVGEIVHGLAS